ncbi:flagellar hook-associated protein FlgK [Sphingomonas baiyangensis]|uniref:Flagellar hook-associated protein 1 n=1 Tax=Sphingomonas baiyangensis TaxID=2572576 RepID=A0A4U1L4L1_9SPHN|nr:flagellar hook-associated protein FlgK [Sphingomonas baiyangensis]TKD51153.1 flagellar hook-associated protein FlgK [Sphingomonas baiyangensis]
MSNMLAIGASGVRAYQGALTTTSENIVNAGTAGYVRRTAQQREVTGAGAGLLTGNAIAGSGVAITGVARAADMFREAAVRTAEADAARTDTGLVWLDRIEGALTMSALDDRLAAFFNAGQAVAADPSATAPRAVMLEQASALAASFRSTGSSLEAALADLDAEAGLAAQSLTSLAAGIARVNAGLSRTSAGSAGQASLLDERDRLLGEMSALIDLDVQYDTAGRASVRAGSAGGPLLVAGDQAGNVTFARNAEGAASISVQRAGQTAVAPANGGKLAGLVDGVARVVDALAAVDTLAADFVVSVNAVQAGGEDMAGAPGGDWFAGERASQMQMVLGDPRGIAAASAGAGARDNGNIAALAALRDSGGFEDRLVEQVGVNAAAIDGRRVVAQAQDAIRTSALAARGALSGVNLDEEAVDLMRFQQAYQASSRVIQIASEAIQSILDIR